MVGVAPVGGDNVDGAPSSSDLIRTIVHESDALKALVAAALSSLGVFAVMYGSHSRPVFRVLAHVLPRCHFSSVDGVLIGVRVRQKNIGRGLGVGFRSRRKT